VTPDAVADELDVNAWAGVAARPMLMIALPTTAPMVHTCLLKLTGTSPFV
jgi:hypothetical protein